MPGKPPPRWVPPTGCGNAPDCARGRRCVEARPICSRECRRGSVPRSSRRSSRPDPSSIDVRRSLSCAASQRRKAQARAAASEARGHRQESRRIGSGGNPEPTRAEEAHMSTVTTKDGVTIFYKDWGPKNAQPIVFHHGWPLSGDDWDTQMLYFLGKGYRVVAH